MIGQQLCLMSSGLRMATSYTVFLSENSSSNNNTVERHRRPKLADQDSEPKLYDSEHKMLFESSAVVATKGCE